MKTKLSAALSHALCIFCAVHGSGLLFRLICTLHTLLFYTPRNTITRIMYKNDNRAKQPIHQREHDDTTHFLNCNIPARESRQLVISDATGTLKAEGTLLVAGAVVVVAGLLGCIASSQRDRTLLLAYGCLMIASGLLEAGVGIWCFVDSDLANDIQDYPLPYNASAPPSSSTSGKGLEVAYLPMEEGKYSVSQPILHLKAWYGQPAHTEYTRVVDHVQERLSCCGLTGPKDYLSSEWEDQANASFPVVPRSCCLTILPEVTFPCELLV
ncbi:CD151 antigen-like [Penaeus indicus]|uniref:CD151 antigen-like n=1 Tax=Penaeus indicus TaxID=29960 RepID=UPI00300CFEE9